MLSSFLINGTPLWCYHNKKAKEKKQGSPFVMLTDLKSHKICLYDILFYFWVQGWAL